MKVIKVNNDIFVEWDEANLAKFSWSAGLSDRSIDQRGNFNEGLQGQWHTLRVLYYCSRLVVSVDDVELQTIDGIGRSTQSNWIVAATDAEANIWLDNVQFWNLDDYISCPASSAPPTVTALGTAQPTLDARKLNPANGHYYQPMGFAKSWHDAEDVCKQQGAHLVTIQDEEENNFVWMLQDQSGPVWFGASDEVEEGNWVWVTGEPWDFSNWDTNEPSNSGGEEHYLSLFVTPKWNDTGDMLQDFICEWEPVVDTSFYSSIQTYITVQPPTFEDDFSTPRPVWGKTNKGLPIDSFVGGWGSGCR